MVKSMTGFGHAEAVSEKRKLTVEMKSVNNRYLDVNIRMPKKFSAFEAQIRNVLKEFVSRGKVDVFISEETFAEGAGEVVLNTALAKQYMDACNSISNELGIDGQVKITDIARFPDVITVREPETDEDELWAEIEEVVRACAEKFNAARIAEGERLRADLTEKLHQMESNVAYIEEHEPQIMADYRARLMKKLSDILEDRTIDENQLATALIIYSDKICTDEETVRLKSHIIQMIDELGKDESVGRKLDFLAQEMNRESNTILSKAGDLATSNVGIELKTEVEKIREQIQNIE
ncbi:MAG: YicC family protein [Lachnospiraceae bacterium]|nr:YicC family protein [Lachnospiraceae bacterium]